MDIPKKLIDTLADAEDQIQGGLTAGNMTEGIEKCPKCGALKRCTFSYGCGSIAPNWVCPSFVQSDECKTNVVTADRDRWQMLAEELARLAEKCIPWHAASATPRDFELSKAIAAIRAAGGQ